MNKYKRGKIAPFSVFAMLFVTRVLVVLTYTTSITVGKISTDMVFSVLLSILLSLLFSVPNLVLVKKSRNPLDNKWISASYGIYFLYLGALNISRFSYFASTKLNTEANSLFIAALIILACTYGAYAGIEAVARFGSFVFIAALIGVFVLIVFNLNYAETANLFPLITNKPRDIFFNAIFLSSNTTEIIIYLAISKKTNGKCGSKLVSAIVLSLLTVALIWFIVLLVLGDNANYQMFPAFTLSQLGQIGNYNRLDVIHTAIWIFLIFIKGTLFIYFASESVKKPNHTYRCLICGILVFLATILFTKSIYASMKIKYISMALFFLFAIIIPLVSLFFTKKKKGDELIEKSKNL